jgi:uncharacterized protein YjbI with pentapeptide repeats
MKTIGQDGADHKLIRAEDAAAEIIAQNGPDFEDIERRQVALCKALQKGNLANGSDELKDAGLQTYNLSWLDLHEGDLPRLQADRLRADKLAFTLANLEESQLTGATFEAAVGVRSNLQGSCMDGTNWSNAVMTGSNMRDVSARGAHFVETILNEVDFTGADLRGARFIGTHLINVIGLDKAKTAGAIFRGARMLNEQAEPLGPLTDSEGALNRAVLTQMLTAPVERQEAAIKSARERNLLIGNSILRASGLEISGLLLGGVKAEDLVARGLIFVETDLTGARFIGANFDEAIGTDAILRAARLSGCTFRRAILSGADMVEAWLPGADFTGADLTGVNFTGANLAGAVFDRTNIEGAIGLDRAVTTGLVVRDVYRSIGAPALKILGSDETKSIL